MPIGKSNGCVNKRNEHLDICVILAYTKDKEIFATVLNKPSAIQQGPDAPEKQKWKSENGKAEKEKRKMKILVAFDGSKPAKKALRLAREHARAFQAETIYVINCLEGDAQTQIQHLEEAEQHLAYARVFLNEADINSETKLSTDAIGAGEEIVAFAEEKNIDEIIIGIVQKSKVGKLLFGSTAQYVILNAICPVVTVKSPASLNTLYPVGWRSTWLS